VLISETQDGRRASRRSLLLGAGRRIGDAVLGAALLRLGVPDAALAQTRAGGPQGAVTAAVAGSSQIDADVQEVYTQFVRTEMPGVPVELVQAAKREGTVTFYHLVNPANTVIVAAFQDRFPYIKVETQEMNGGALVQRFMSEAEAKARIADVVQLSSTPDAQKALADHFVLQYSSEAEHDFQTTHYVPGYIAPVSGEVMGIGYNPQRISDADAAVFRSWDGLMDPRWHGKRFAVAEVLGGGSTELLNYYEYQKYGTRLWQQMASSGYAIYPGAVQQSDSVVSGETDIAAGMPGALIAAKWDTGAPIHWKFPQPFLAAPAAQFINASAPHPNAAKLLQEYCLTRQAQEFIVAGGSVSFRTGVQQTAKYAHEAWYIAPDAKLFWKFTDQALAAAMPDIAAKWRAIFK